MKRRGSPKLLLLVLSAMRTSEHLAAQAELFDEKVDVPVPPEEKIRITYDRQRRGRPALPKNLPRERADIRSRANSILKKLRQLRQRIYETRY